MIHLYNGLLLRNENGKATYTFNNLKDLKGNMLSERSQSQKLTSFIIPFTWHSWKENYSDREQISGCQGIYNWERIWLQRESMREISGALQLFLFLIVVVVRSIYLKIHETAYQNLKKSILLYIFF